MSFPVGSRDLGTAVAAEFELHREFQVIHAQVIQLQPNFSSTTSATQTLVATLTQPYIIQFRF